MYPQGEEFIEYVKICFPDYFHNTSVLDISTLLNQNQKHFTECDYYITDVTNDDNEDNITNVEDMKPNRDLLSAKELEFDDETFNVIISTECLEYDPTWDRAIKNIEKMLNHNGLFLLVFEYLNNNLINNPINIYKLNNILNFDETFAYWDCYQDNNFNKFFFVGVKKNINKIKKNNKNYKNIIKYDNSISNINNSNITLITDKIKINF